MGLLILFLLSFYYVVSATNYDVTSYGAKGDGNTDDTKAFVQAWADVCRKNSPGPTLIIPSAKTFLVSPVEFTGPCQSDSVHIQLLGSITAPKTLNGWKNCIEKQFWIQFYSVKGLTINGPGKIDGQGSVWWGKQDSTDTCNRPTALHFSSCNNLRLSHTTHINSPSLHISIVGCQSVDLGYLRIIAPGDSPNTDGIDLAASSYVNIHDSSIQTGDDCLAINGGVVDVNVTGVLCGPGHGISIGSLGENGRHDTVEQIRIQDCNITGATNGLRIKTVPKGSGYAKGIIYKDIHLVNVQNPIIIDQHYCLTTNNLESYCPEEPGEAAVVVTNVMYTNIYGSSATQQAIIFNCSIAHKCTGIQTKQVRITGNGVVAHCENTRGSFVDTAPPITCY